MAKLHNLEGSKFGINKCIEKCTRQFPRFFFFFFFFCEMEASRENLTQQMISSEQNLK